MDKKKKTYETPELMLHGSVQNITQAALMVGSGDAWAVQNLHMDILEGSG